MKQFDMIIKNGTVVLPDKVKKTNIVIKNGVIVAISDESSFEAERIIDASGQYVFPGMIDVHVHFSDPGREYWEGFRTGSQMMAAGGCTTFFDMPLNGIPSTIDKEALYAKSDKGNQESYTDFALWGGLVPGNENHLAELAEEGVIGFKAFLSTTGNKEFENVDDITLLNGMKIIAGLNKVLALHSESGPITDWLTAEKVKAGHVSADDYLATRPIAAEAEAVQRALYYAEVTGCPLHFVHISSAEAIEKIEEAKSKGMNVTVETCPHYLLFNQNTLREKGAVAKCAPPLRMPEEQEKLIQLLINKKFDMISSDHSPCTSDLKDPATYNLFQAWGGISGGQFSFLSMMELALKHNIPFEHIAEWTALNPAGRFGLSSKGKIAEGYDADIVLVSVDESFTVTEDNFFAKNKISVYIGHTFPCKVMSTINRGQVVYEEGVIRSEQASGKWITPKK
ncbi:allantoinase [Bacillus sp. ISL-40]|uniref:allantoinase n=1 Tax=unclassified Bacillus (in: firmicutes) TaxID=185979 RepID=UPI001BE7DB2A|nr:MULTISPECIES: allantoinase [unclassified Bacillus (in: firmicutes)]MBT2696153.1 allantoinase [Bacillus sp. ISL-40]MBT2743000.1 allantoinase [Bacillus sp. ISL-77]